MKKYIYKNKEYCLIKNTDLFENIVEIKTIKEDNELIEVVPELKETDEALILILNKHKFNENIPTYIEIEKEELIFNKDTFRCVGDKISILMFNNIYQKDIMILLLDKLLQLNNNINEFFIENASKFLLKESSYSFLNLINMCLFNFNELEKFVTSNNMNFIIKNINNADFNIFENLDVSKLHQVVGLPKFAMKMIKEAKMETYINALQKLSEKCDGNSFKIFLQFFIDSKIILDSTNYTKSTLINFISIIEELLDKKYRIKDLLNYLLKQSYFYSNNKAFQFPFEELTLLKDYIDMCENFELKYDRYPSQLKKTHDIIAKNVNVLQEITSDLNDKFEEATICYEEVEQEITIGTGKDKEEYIFIVPKTINELIQEGNNLNHCVGAFSNKIINNISHIVFMRNKDNPNKSYITIDIKIEKNPLNNKKEYFLKEAKQNFNEDIDSNQLKIVKKWLEIINN